MDERVLAIAIGVLAVTPVLPGTWAVVDDLFRPRVVEVPGEWRQAEDAGTIDWIEVRLDRRVDGPAHLDVTLDAPPDVASVSSDELWFAEGDDVAWISLEVFDDDEAEADATYELRIHETDEIAVDDGSVAVPIIVEDDDRPAAVTIVDQTHLYEGTSTEAGATVEWGVAVGLTEAVDHDVEIDWAARARPAGRGAAEAGTDFVAVSGTIVIPAGQTYNDALSPGAVEIFTDLWPEPDERFDVVIVEVRGAEIEDGSAEYLLRNDDPPGASLLGGRFSFGG